MQKKIIALAVAALASGVAMAQSNVTVYGVVDACYGYGSTSSKGAVDAKKFSGINDGGSCGLQGSRIGFKGEEALGNGLKAVFTLEYGTDSTSFNSAATTAGGGTLNNVRQSFVGLTGGFGTVSLGRQYAPSYDYLGNTSSNGVTQVHASNNLVGFFTTMQTGSGARWNNSVKYVSPNFSGFEGRAIYAFGEQIRDSYGDASTDASMLGLGGSYTNGPLFVTAMYQQILENDALALDNGQKAYALGGSYDFKVVKVFANYIREKTELGAADLTAKYWSLGAGIPVSQAGAVQLEYAQFKTDLDETKSKGFSVGYTHALSKRTTLYTSLSRMSNEDAVGATFTKFGIGTFGASTTQFGAGINHKF